MGGLVDFKLVLGDVIGVDHGEQDHPVDRLLDRD